MDYCSTGGRNVKLRMGMDEKQSDKLRKMFNYIYKFYNGANLLQ